MKIFGTGPTLRDACPWLRDESERHARILEVTERNSIIEGLPPFREETRQRILSQLQFQAGVAREEEAPSSSPSAADSPA